MEKELPPELHPKLIKITSNLTKEEALKISEHIDRGGAVIISEEDTITSRLDRQEQAIRILAQELDEQSEFIFPENVKKIDSILHPNHPEIAD